MSSTNSLKVCPVGTQPTGDIVVFLDLVLLI